MSEQSFVAKIGLRLGVLGSSASLAIAAPVADNNYSPSAHTAATRTGVYFPTNASLGVVANGAEAIRVYSDSGVQIGGSYGASPGAGILAVPGGWEVVRSEVSGEVHSTIANTHATGASSLYLNLSGSALVTYFGSSYPFVSGAIFPDQLALWGFGTGGVAILSDAGPVHVGDSLVEWARFWTDGSVQIGGTYTTGLGMAGRIKSAKSGKFFGIEITRGDTTFGAATDCMSVGDYEFLPGVAGWVFNTNCTAVGLHQVLGSFANHVTVIGDGIGVAGNLAGRSSACGALISLGAYQGTAVGYGVVIGAGHDNATAIGANVSTTAANQVIIGDTAITQYVFSGAVGSQVIHGLGAALLPSVTFTGDLNTGIWSSGADSLSISTGGTEKMRWFSDGGVQIGGAYGASPGAGSLYIQGKLTVIGLIDPTGLALSTVAANPGGALAASTLWVKTSDSKLYLGADSVFVGALAIPVGTALLPGLPVVGDPDTGLWSPGANQLSISTAGVERVSIGLSGVTTLSGDVLMPLGWQVNGTANDDDLFVAIANSDFEGVQSIHLGPTGTTQIIGTNYLAVGWNSGVVAQDQLALYSEGAGGIALAADYGPIRFGQFISNQVEWMRIFLDGGVQIGGTYSTSPGVGQLKVAERLTVGTINIDGFDAYSASPYTNGNMLVGSITTPGFSGRLYFNTHSTVIGRDCLVYYASNCVTIGYGVTMSGSGGQSVAIGANAYMNQDYSVALGAGANVSHANSIAIGYGVATTAADQVIIGAATTTNYVLRGAAASGLLTGKHTIDLSLAAAPAGMGGSALDVFGADTGPATFSFATFGNANGPTIHSYNVGGTRLSRTATLAASGLIILDAAGYGTSLATGGVFKCEAGSLWSGSNHETAWIMQGVSSGSTSLAEWVRWQNGAQQLAVGSAALPSYSFTSKTGNGFWSPTGDTVALSTGGVERLRWFSDGGVQIGGTFTTSPGAGMLSVNGVLLGRGVGSTTNILVGSPTAGTGVTDNVVVGSGTTVNSDYTSILGASASVGTGSNYGIAIGYGAAISTSSANAIAIGSQVSIAGSKPYAVAIGYGSNAGDSGVGIGRQANASGADSVALGRGASATASNSTAIGNGASNSVTNTVVIGNSSVVQFTLTGNAASQVVIGVGTALLPSLTFLSDLNTGIWSSGADSVSVSTNGTEKMRWFSDGGVQIGGTYTTSPGAGILSASGGFLSGITAPLATFTDGTVTPVLQVVGASANASSIGLAAFSATAAGHLNMAVSGGTTVGDYTAVAAGRVLGRVRMQGADGTDFSDAVMIEGVSEGTISAGVVPGVFRVRTRNAAGTTVIALDINSAQNAAFAGDVAVAATKAVILGDNATDGSWQMIRSGDNLLIQRRESAAWVTKQTILA